jgi:RimJ/RimL family protein N-acetyltransferase
MITIESITKEDYENIKNITQDEDVMKYIGNGKIFSEDDLNKFIDSSIKKEINYYKIMERHRFIGLVGLNPFLKKDSLTIMFDKKSQGQGYLKPVLEAFYKFNNNQHFSIIVKEKNKKMMKLANKYFKKDGRRLINGVLWVYLYTYPLTKEKNIFL